MSRAPRRTRRETFPLTRLLHLQCYDSLRKSAAGQQTKANIEEFLVAVKVRQKQPHLSCVFQLFLHHRFDSSTILQPIALTSAECLNIINLKPSSDVEVHLVRQHTLLLLSFDSDFVCD